MINKFLKSDFIENYNKLITIILPLLIYSLYAYYFGYYKYFGIDISYINVDYIEIFYSSIIIISILIGILFFLEIFFDMIINSKIFILFIAKVKSKEAYTIIFMIFIGFLIFIIKNLEFLFYNFIYIWITLMTLGLFVIFSNFLVGKYYGDKKILEDLKLYKRENKEQKHSDSSFINKTILICFSIFLISGFFSYMGDILAKNKSIFDVVLISKNEYIIFSKDNSEIVTKKLEGNKILNGVYLFERKDIYNNIIYQKELKNILVEK